MAKKKRPARASITVPLAEIGPYREAYDTINREYNKLHRKLHKGGLTPAEVKDISRRLLHLAYLRKEAQMKHKQLTRESLPLGGTSARLGENPCGKGPAANPPYQIKTENNLAWDERADDWVGSAGTIYDTVDEMPRSLPYGTQHVIRTSSSGSYSNIDGEVVAQAVPLRDVPRRRGAPRGKLRPARNPSLDIPPHARPSASVVDQYTKFHGVPPSRVDTAKLWIPGRLVLIGHGVDIGYGVTESDSSKDGRYVHDFGPSVKVYRRAKSGEVADKTYRNFPTEFWVLGATLGFTYFDGEQEQTLRGSKRRKLCVTKDRKRLVVMGAGGVEFLCIGGKMRIADWIYD